MKEIEIFTSSIIQKYSKYSTPQLRIKAGEKFRAWIRKRDKGKRCISCGSWEPSDAGHFYSAGHYPSLEFNEDNVNIQCRQCNYHKHSNALEYRKSLVKKIGIERVERLDQLADQYKRIVYKHDRFNLIMIIEKYK